MMKEARFPCSFVWILLIGWLMPSCFHTNSIIRFSPRFVWGPLLLLYISTGSWFAVCLVKCERLALLSTFWMPWRGLIESLVDDVEERCIPCSVLTAVGSGKLSRVRTT